MRKRKWGKKLDHPRFDPTAGIAAMAANAPMILTSRRRRGQ